MLITRAVRAASRSRRLTFKAQSCRWISTVGGDGSTGKASSLESNSSASSTSPTESSDSARTPAPLHADRIKTGHAEPWAPQLSMAEGGEASFAVDKSGLYERVRKDKVAKPPLTEFGELLTKGMKKVGPISLALFMEMCLFHPEFGYYTTKEKVIGKEGDFITAPEISQMFGEMVGVWAVATWEKLGSPQGLRLVEIGPGKGTLMKDILRTARTFKPFSDAIREIDLVERSQVLREMQAETLQSTKTDGGATSPLIPAPISWHAALNEVPDDGPIILFAQELLDALPVHQFQFTKDGWRDREVYVDDDPNSPTNFQIIVAHGQTRPVECFEKSGLAPVDPQVGQVVEVNPVALEYVKEIATRVGKNGGAALFIDYGENYPQEDTLRGLKQHDWAHPLEDPGNVDLSADVDFSALTKQVDRIPGTRAIGPVPQGQFLAAMGIEVRFNKLIESDDVTDRQAQDLFESVRRLIDPNQMGRKYKAWAIVHKGHQGPVTGFQAEATDATS